MMQRVLLSSGLKRMGGLNKFTNPVMRSFSNAIDPAELTMDVKPMNHPEDAGVTFQETAIVPHGDAGTFADPILVRCFWLFHDVVLISVN